MSGLMGDSWTLLLASASNLFQHHMSRSLWKMPRYAHEGMRGKKANNVSRFVFVVRGCCNKWPQTWWLTTIEVCSLTRLDARSLKSKCPRGHASSTDSGGRGEPPALPGSQLGHLSISLQLHTSFSSVCPSFKEIFTYLLIYVPPASQRVVPILPPRWVWSSPCSSPQLLF